MKFGPEAGVCSNSWRAWLIRLFSLAPVDETLRAYQRDRDAAIERAEKAEKERDALIVAYDEARQLATERKLTIDTLHENLAHARSLVKSRRASDRSKK